MRRLPTSGAVELPDGRHIPGCDQLEMRPFVYVFAKTKDEEHEEPRDSARWALLEETGFDQSRRLRRQCESSEAVSHMFHATGC
jgi:hypothetical protein